MKFWLLSDLKVRPPFWNSPHHIRALPKLKHHPGCGSKLREGDSRMARGAMFHVKHTAALPAAAMPSPRPRLWLPAPSGPAPAPWVKSSGPASPASERISAAREFSLIRNLRHGRIPTPEVRRGPAGQAAEKLVGAFILSGRRRRISYVHENAQSEILRAVHPERAERDPSLRSG